MSSISVIVPVYNSEKTLERCLNSIKNQTYTDFEVILVNDGSTDDSLNICKTFSNVDSRFKVIDQENSGPSAARNRGIDNSNGKYLTFVDSDDFLSDDALEEFYKAAEINNAELTICGFNKKNQNDELLYRYNSRYKPGLYVGEACRKIAVDSLNMFDFQGVRAFSAIRFIRSDCLKKYNLRYDLRVLHSEDYLLWTKVFFQINRLCLITDKLLYNYVDNAESITHKYIPDFWESIKVLYNDLISTLPPEKEIKDNLNITLVQLANTAANIAVKASDKKTVKNDLKKVLSDKHLKKIAKTVPVTSGIKRTAGFKLLMRLNLCWVIKIYYILKHWRLFKNR